jgi:aryl-alcohol dehydrogenase-like predicted oxidoreductase
LPLVFFSYRQVVSTITGILNEKEIEENIIASDLGPLEADQIRELQKSYQETRFLIKDKTLKSVQYHG